MIELTEVTKTYSRNNNIFTALDNINLNIEKSDYLLINGMSGAGKSTLLYIIGGLIKPDKGSVKFNEQEIYSMQSKDRVLYRKKNVGFVFQQFHLMPYLTVYDNIKLACYDKSHLEQIDFYLNECDIRALKNKYPSELSVGEKQRTAFIRAIISNPDLLLADEPTGNLDELNAKILMKLIGKFHENGGTVIIVSHSPEISFYAKRTLILDKGKIKKI